ncbi:MAG: DUF116 domain-containing protein [Euryarchaeota archaeon]|nr:DUF116 domain-containing protein [Euryarchaeota archaeon]
MVLESQPGAHALMLLGGGLILLLLLFLLFAFIVVGVVFLSIKQGKFYFPRLIRAGFAYIEGTIKNICAPFGLKEAALTIFFIQLHNKMSEGDFAKTEIKDRAIFLPHCLRSLECPASLSEEGLFCKHCGKCELDRSVTELEEMGYRVFIVPGSTFIGRMVKKYKPRAIIGVGCLREIKDGLKFADGLGVVAMGVVNRTDGCVETLANWPELMKVASLQALKV